MRHIVVVGASLAGLRSAEALRRHGFNGSITVIGEEPEMPYDRPPLSKDVLAGTKQPEDVRLPEMVDPHVTWKLGSAATGLDPVARVVTTEDGDQVPYDGVVLATGSSARPLPSFDTRAPHVHSLRTLADAVRLRSALGPGTRLLIVGCGFVGIEVASSARSLGADVTMVGLDPPVAPAGQLASERATRLLQDNGIDLRVGHTVASAEDVGDWWRATLSDGTLLEADHVLVAAGAVPNVGWLASSGLDLSNGVECDAALRVVGLDDVVAAGDIVHWPNAAFGGLGMRVEHWSNAVEQGAAAARSLLGGTDAEPFGSVPSFWSDHFGVRLQSVGLPRLANRMELTDGDPAEGTFCAAAYFGDVLVGGVSYGMPRSLVQIRMQLVSGGVALQPAIS